MKRKMLFLLICSFMLVTFAQFFEEKPKQPVKFAADWIEYNTAQDEVYCRGSVLVTLEDGKIFCDQAMVNTAAKEVYAYGHVRYVRFDEKTLKRIEKIEKSKKKKALSPDDESYSTDVKADFLRFNYEFNHLYANDFDGHSKNAYFKMPEVRSLSRNEGIGRQCTVTTCNLPHPHYSFRCKEIEVFYDERVFAKGATLLFDRTPIFYMPYYTKTLGEGSPWNMTLGRDSDLGTFVKLGYLFRHKVYADNKKKVKLASWKVHLQGEHYSDRGEGILAEGDYSYYNDRFKGKFQSYFIQDENYEIARRRDNRDDEEVERDRYSLTTANRWELPGDFIFRFSMNAYRDPDIYTDFFSEDLFDAMKMNRTAEASLTRVFDQYYFNLAMRYKETLDCVPYHDYYKTWDDDYMFDGIDYNSPWPYDTKNKYYETQRQLPILRFERSYLALNKYFHYKFSFETFNSKDTGVMPQEDTDDAWVRGISMDNRLLFGINLTKRINFTSKTGFILGYAERESERYGGSNFTLTGDQPIAAGSTMTKYWLNASMIQNYYDDIDNEVMHFYSYNDLSYKFADNLRLHLLHSYGHNLGYSFSDFYRDTARKNYRTDIYDFPEEENFVGISLRHSWDKPRYRSNLFYYENMRSSLYPDEPLRKLGYKFSIQFLKPSLRLSFGPYWEKRNKKTRTNGIITDYSEDAFAVSAGIRYKYYIEEKNRRKNKWWISSNVTYLKEDDDDPNKPANANDLEDVSSRWVTSVGWHLSKKWYLIARYSYDIEESMYQSMNFSFKRDLHCWFMSLNYRMSQNVDSNDDDFGEKKSRLSVNFGLKTFSRLAVSSNENYADTQTYNNLYDRMESFSQ